MDAEVFRRSGEVAAVALQDPRDELLLELPLRLGEQDPPVDHLGDQSFQLLLHETFVLLDGPGHGPGDLGVAGFAPEALERLHVLLERP